MVSHTCQYHNPLTKNLVDLKQMKTAHYSVDTTPYTVHFARCGELLGDGLEGKRCSGKRICVKDQRNNRVLSFGTSEDELEVFATGS